MRSLACDRRGAVGRAVPIPIGRIRRIWSGPVGFSLDRLVSHVDFGTAEEAEDFVRLTYEQLHIDLCSNRSGKTGY